MFTTACGPKRNGRRIVISGHCTRDCPHYEECCDEISVLPPEHDFIEVDATIERMEEGRTHQNYKGAWKQWEMIKVKTNEI